MKQQLLEILEQVEQGHYSAAHGAAAISKLEQSGSFACLDHQRQARTGQPEVVFGENKSGEQIKAILADMLHSPGVVMATRVSQEKADLVCQELAEVQYHPEARMLVARVPGPESRVGRGLIRVVCAGTSDLPVAREAELTALCLGNQVELIHDVGVAGIHRLYNRLDELQQSTVVIVVAGMEGALPSVVAGLIAPPVIAVPVSVGYGTGTGGIAALLGMLNSCAHGLAVVNIDNGFGAACMAAAINRQ